MLPSSKPMAGKYVFIVAFILLAIMSAIDRFNERGRDAELRKMRAEVSDLERKFSELQQNDVNDRT